MIDYLISDILIGKGKNDTKKFWQAKVLHDAASDEYYHQTVSWHTTVTGGESKKVYSEPYRVEAKNIGRANETTLEQQAILEYNAIVKKQMERGYAKEGEVADILPQPMLAHKYLDRKHTLLSDANDGTYKFPIWVQPKLNGMRMLTDGITAWSRGGKQILPDVVKHILPHKKLPYIYDGELILPNNVLLQETMKAAKKYRPGISEQLCYYVYDCVSPESYKDRLAIILMNNKINIRTVDTWTVTTEKELFEAHKKFVAQGFEGTIIRSDGTGYESGQRSNQLLKYKDFVDAEFKIVDVVDGEGSDKDCAIFVCENSDGRQFNCKPEGKKAYAKELYKKRKTLLGQWLTIRYQELSADNVPIFPVGVSIRENGEF